MRLASKRFVDPRQHELRCALHVRTNVRPVTAYLDRELLLDGAEPLPDRLKILRRTKRERLRSDDASRLRRELVLSPCARLTHETNVLDVEPARAATMVGCAPSSGSPWL